MLSYEQVKEVSANQTIQIVDNRPQPAFESGKIDNSKNVPGPHMLNQDGTTKTKDEIKLMFTNAGVNTASDMAFSCTAGVLSALTYACAEKAGFTGKLHFYDGSWSEFAARKA